MSIYIPVVQKIYYSKPTYIERVLPKQGELAVREGLTVDPVTRLGITKVSYGLMPIDKSLKIVKGRTDDGFFYKGERIGRVGLNYVIAPYNGYLSKEKDKYLYHQEDRDYRLMAGVWGTVTGVVKDKSTLIKTQTVDIPFTYSVGANISGELVVFPNPSELLELQYLEHYTKGAEGKVIYIGAYASSEFLEGAVQKKVRAVLAGGADKQSFIYAKRNNLFLGVFNGYGRLPVANVAYDFLKEISSRYVFIDSKRNLLRVPVPEDFTFTHKIPTNASLKHLREVVPGLQVQVFIKPYFGWFGEVESVQDDIIYVNLHNAEEKLAVSVPNILAIA